MKKIIFLIICLCSIDVVYAVSLEYEYLPYYVKLTRNGVDTIVQVKKVYDKTSNEVVFNIDSKYYEVNNDYEKNSEVTKDNYGRYHDYINFFNSIVYYGYNENKSDKNYFYTQVIIWNLISSCLVTIVDSEGNELSDLMSEFRTLWSKSLNHDVNPLFSNKKYNINIGDTLELNYSVNNKILDNPIIDGLSFTNDGRKLYIHGEKVGEYKVDLKKDYENINYGYSSDNSYYWQSLGGPGDISKYFYVNVLGVNLKIKENLIGINNKFGDALLENSKYEVYLDNNLYLTITDLENNLLKPNSIYFVKDISNNIGINNGENIEIEVKDNDYILEINKNVISKNISIDILDNYTYEIYLKSNNELYEIIDSNTDLIILPYGLYYINSKDNDYYQELEVTNNIDEVLLINNYVEEEKKEEINKEQDKVVEEKAEIQDEVVEEIIKTEEKITEKEEMENENIIEEEVINEIENPKTNDNIYGYLNLFLICFVLIVILYKGVISD